MGNFYKINNLYTFTIRISFKYEEYQLHRDGNEYLHNLNKNTEHDYNVQRKYWGKREILRRQCLNCLVIRIRKFCKIL